MSRSILKIYTQEDVDNAKIEGLKLVRMVQKSMKQRNSGSNLVMYTCDMMESCIRGEFCKRRGEIEFGGKKEEDKEID